MSRISVSGEQKKVVRQAPKKNKMSASSIILDFIFETSVTMAVVIGLFIAYALWFTGFETQQAQEEMQNQIVEEWGENPEDINYGEEIIPGSDNVPSPPPPGEPAPGVPGEEGSNPSMVPASNDNPYANTGMGETVPASSDSPFTVMTIPALGDDWKWIVGQGITDADMRKGPSWYPDTQLPGQRGNMVVGAHESGYNAPFVKIWERLPVCSDIIVETPQAKYVYKTLPHSEADIPAFENCAPTAASIWKEHYQTRDIYATQVVSPNQYNIVYPVPNSDSTYNPEWTMPLLSLQTCYPHLQSTERTVVRSALHSVEERV